MTEVRALTAGEWRRPRLARMAAVEGMPYVARALFALSPVAAPGLKTFAVDKHWRLYVDPAMLGTDEGWSIPLDGAVLLHEVGHVLRDHGGRADTVASPVDRTMWNYAADAEIHDGASARNRGLNTETFATAAAIAVVLIDNAIPTAAVPSGAGGNLSTGTAPRAGSGGELSRI